MNNKETLQDLNSNPFETITKNNLYFDYDRIEIFRSFLFDQNLSYSNNNYNIIDYLRPISYVENLNENFEFIASEIVANRFMKWYESDAFIKILIIWENKLFINDKRRTKANHKNELFFIDYLTYIKSLYFYIKNYKELKINNIRNFRYFYYFLNQIEEYIISGVSQFEPMYKSDLLELIYKWFQDNLRDVVTFNTPTDIEKLILVKYAPYFHHTTNNSLIHCETNLYTYELLFFDEQTFNIMYTRFKDIDDLQEFEDEIGQFCENSLGLIDDLKNLNPF